VEIIDVCYHETRHAYQAYCIRNNSYEDERIIGIWKNDISNYKKPTDRNSPKDNSTYLEQAIEIDAFAFASMTLYELFDKTSEIPHSIRNHVIERIKEIKNNTYGNGFAATRIRKVCDF
jgi:hypothetical protein